MKLTDLFKEDNAVSPVIGVILMVAITVILAAVIGAFVLNIGGSQDTAPSASLEFTFADSQTATIEHAGGATLDDSTLKIKVGGTLAYEGQAGTQIKSSFANGDEADNWGSKVKAGDTVTLDASSSQSGNDVIVTWQSPSSDKTSVLGSTTWSS